MRKLLSIILAITMIATLIPAVFAADTDNVKIVYDLSRHLGELGLTTTNCVEGTKSPFDINETVTDGFYKVGAGTLDKWNNTNKFIYPCGVNGATLADNIGFRENRPIVFQIYIPVRGTYSIDVNHGTRKAAAVDVQVYVYKGVVTSNFTEESAYVGSYSALDATNGDYFSKLKNSVVANEDGSKATFEADESGIYTISFCAGSTATNQFGSVGTFTLTSGTGANAVIMNGKIEGETNLIAGESAALTASGYNSATTEALTGWTYSTTDTDIVDVNATTGVVTAKKQGKATISATANGVVNAITTTINVTQPGVAIKYAVGEDLYRIDDETKAAGGATLSGTAEGSQKLTFDETDNFYAWKDQSGRVSTSAKNFIQVRLDTNKKMGSFRIRADKQWIAFVVNVPVAGVYKMNIRHGANAAGAKVTNVHVAEGKDWSTTNMGKVLGSYSCYYSELAYNADYFSKIYDEPAEISNIEIKTPGMYVVTFQTIGDDGVTPNNAKYGSVSSFELISGDGSQVAIMNGKIAGDSVIREGASATLTASGYNSVTREALTGWTYSTTDTDVVEVNATTGVVTAKAPGTATITAKTGSAVNSVSTTVTVPNENAYTIKYDVSGIVDKFGMKAQSEGASSLHFSQLDYAHTNGMFEYVASSVSINGINSAISYLGKRFVNMDGTVGRYVRMKINVPISGKYTMDIDHCYGHRGGDVSVSIGKKIDNLLEVGTYSTHSYDGENSGYFSPSCSTTSTVVDADGSAAVFDLEKGEYYIEFKNKAVGAGNADGANKQARGSIGTFKLIAGNDTANAVKYIGGALSVTQMDSVSGTALPVSEMVPGTSATVTAFGLNSDMSVATGATVSEVTSSDDSILEVNGNTVKAVGYGTATLSATVSYNGVSEVATVEITSVPKETVELLNVVVTANIPNAVTTDVSGLAYGGIKTYATGTVLKATASEEIDGYIFRGWKRGSADNGVWLTTSPILEMTIAANTYLTAVYDADVEEEETVTVEFYNENGQYLESADATGKTFDEIKPEDPTRPGFDFAFWATEKDTPILGTDTFKKLTRAVAQFAEREDAFTVTGPDGFVKNDCKFNEAIEFSADGAGMWYVDGEPVAYGDSYTYYVWSDAAITYDAAASNPNSPIVSMDKDTRDGSYMIHFAGNGYSIVEAGIVFGTNATIESCFDRAASKKSGYVRGQFSAFCDGQDARGYVIYRDGIIYRVAYTD